MRLLTHNQLMCIRKGCPRSFPLSLSASSVEQEESACNPAFIAHLMVNVDYNVLYEAAKKLGIAAGLPEPESKLPDFVALSTYHSKQAQEFDSDDDDDEATDAPTEKKTDSGDKTEGEMELLSTLHTVLMDTHVQEGEMVCDGCARKYPIQQGIPNMRLNEDEV